MNAPRLLTKVSGDFAVQVKVTGEFSPGPKSLGKGNPFNSAGILIWQDNDNYLRIERDVWQQGDSLWCYPPLIEYWRDREYAGMNVQAVPAQFFPGRSTWLRAVRRGDQITVSLSDDGRKWREVRTFAVKFAAEVQVGVAALNTSDEPFVVDIEDLRITRDGVASMAVFKSVRNDDGPVEVVAIQGGTDRIDVQWEPAPKIAGEPRTDREESK